MARSSAKHSAARASDSAPLAALLPSCELALRASGKSPKTIRSNTDSVRKLSAYLAASGLADDVESTGPAEVRAFLVSEIDRTSPASAQVHYRNLLMYFGWLIREGEGSTANPVTRSSPRSPAGRSMSVLRHCGSIGHSPAFGPRPARLLHRCPTAHQRVV